MMEKNEYMPCQNCPNRWVNEHNTCHSTCKKYKKWKMIHLEYMKRKEEQKKIDRDSYSIDESTAIRKNLKYHKRRKE